MNFYCESSQAILGKLRVAQRDGILYTVILLGKRWISSIDQYEQVQYTFIGHDIGFGIVVDTPKLESEY